MKFTVTEIHCYGVDVYSLKFEHKLGYWPMCQLTFIDIVKHRNIRLIFQSKRQRDKATGGVGGRDRFLKATRRQVG